MNIPISKDCTISAFHGDIWISDDRGVIETITPHDAALRAHELGELGSTDLKYRLLEAVKAADRQVEAVRDAFRLFMHDSGRDQREIELQ